MSRVGKVLASAVVPVLFSMNAAWGIQNPPATAPQTAPAAEVDVTPSESLRMFVAEVKGAVQVRETTDKPWKTAKVGMEIGPGADVRTGTHAHVILVIPPNQIIKLDRLGTMSVLEAVKQGKKVTTEFAMKYGRTDYEIQAAGQEHDAKIRTPGATLSVRGTRFITWDQPPFAPQAYTYHGLVDYEYAKRLMKVGQSGRVVGGNNSADTSLLANSVDPATAAARTGSEAVVIANEQSRGAILEYNPITQIQTTKNTKGPQSSTELMSSLPGRLNFILRWDHNADVNLAVVHQAGDPLSLLGNFQPQEFLYPGFQQNQTVSGGKISVDDRGGPQGGQETAYWSNPSNGIFGLQAIHVRGETTGVRFNAFLDGNPLPITSLKLDENGNIVREPFTLPNGTVIQIPVLETANEIDRTLAPNSSIGVNVNVPSLESETGSAKSRRLKNGGNTSAKVQKSPNVRKDSVRPGGLSVKGLGTKGR